MNTRAQIHRRSNLAAIAAAGLVVLVCLFGHLGAIGLVGPDEPRYAWIARTMATTGDWVTPRLYGQPWFEKPVLYYWAAGAGFQIHLPAEWAARLPSALAALLAAIAIGWLAWKHYGTGAEPVGSPWLLAPLIFSTSIAAIGFARAAGPDMLFSAALTLAMASSASVLRQRGALRSVEATPESRTKKPDYVSLALFGAWLGLAVLAKGPAGVVLAAGAIALWAIATRQWRNALRLAHPIAIAAFCIVALPWYLLCAARNPDFIHIFIFQHNFERYLTPMFQHRQPFWYFLPILILGLLPWTVCLWPAAQEGLRLWREKSWRDSPGFFIACWAAFPLVFFSFSQSKLPGYILPAIPPLALLVAVTFASRFDAQNVTTASAPPSRSILPAIGITWIVLSLSATLWLKRLPRPALENPGNAILHLAILGVVAGTAIAVLGLLRQRAALVLALLVTSICVEAAGVRILPALDPYVSARAHAHFLSNDHYPDRIFTFHTTRAWQYGLNFYLDRALPEWQPSDPAAALVLTTPQGLGEIRRLGRVQAALDEPYQGILYVPVLPAPR
jgi:4-amino-4-deoxy-L-arabinose transferase-like glycosyltransferase